MRIIGRRIIRATVGANGPIVVDMRELPHGGICSVDPATGARTELPGHALFGDSDPGWDLEPPHAAVAHAARRFGDHRIGATDTPYHDLLPSVLAQRVTAQEALAQWSALCTGWGTPVEHDGITLWTPPAPDVLMAIPHHEFHLLGIDRRRASTLREVARHGARLISGWRPGESAQQRTLSLRLIPGVGEWTAAVTGYVSFGDPDALEVGDFHAKNTVAFALTGRHRGTDTEMIELLEPYRGQRQRVLQWLRMTGVRAPAHGPRRRIVSIARL